MNQKAIRYFLITGAVLIWGLIIYRVATAAGGDDFPPVTAPVHAVAPDALPVDSFSLYANYPDPFIPDTGTVIITPTANTTTPLSPSAPAAPGPPSPVKVDISFIQYHGMIYNPSKKLKTALMSIRGKETMLREKDSEGEITVRKIQGDRILFLYQHKMYTVYVQK